MRPMKSIYPMFPELLEWLNRNFNPLEQSVFEHYRGIKHLVNVVAKAEDGSLPRYCALSALRDYNEEHGTSIEYNEVKFLEPTYIFSEIGEWVAYTDSKYASDLIVLGEYDDAADAFNNPEEDISWLIVWLSRDAVAVVYRSPYTASRETLPDFEDVTDGLKPGDDAAFVLPPEIEASLGSCDPDEIFQAAELKQKGELHASRS